MKLRILAFALVALVPTFSHAEFYRVETKHIVSSEEAAQLAEEWDVKVMPFSQTPELLVQIEGHGTYGGGTLANVLRSGIVNNVFAAGLDNLPSHVFSLKFAQRIASGEVQREIFDGPEFQGTYSKSHLDTLKAYREAVRVEGNQLTWYGSSYYDFTPNLRQQFVSHFESPIISFYVDTNETREFGGTLSYSPNGKYQEYSYPGYLAPYYNGRCGNIGFANLFLVVATADGGIHFIEPLAKSYGGFFCSNVGGKISPPVNDE